MKESSPLFSKEWIPEEVPTSIIDLCGYFKRSGSIERGSFDFVRKISEVRIYPRFHLLLRKGDQDFDISLHMDVRDHVSIRYGEQICEELERLNFCLNGSTNGTRNDQVNKLRMKFVDLLMFGLADMVNKPQYSFSKDYFRDKEKGTRRRIRSSRRLYLPEVDLEHW